MRRGAAAQLPHELIETGPDWIGLDWIGDARRIARADFNPE
jgi:hypothetical protein